MRDKINNDPKMQVALVALLLIAGAFLLVTKMGGGEEEAAEPLAEATVTVAGTESTATATGATIGEAVEGAAEVAVEGGTVAPSVAPSSIQAPPPPQPVTVAYKEDKTVVLLIVHDGSIDDKLVADSVETLSSLENVVTFVVPASQIYRYASITLGVEVSRVPALVVMRPKGLSKGTPQASVTFGFKNRESVEQAVHDAEYDGPAESYHPN
jgi:hypothetical protein